MGIYANRLNPTDPSEEKCCDNPQIDIRNGNRVCLNCGMVKDTNYVEDERRAYSSEEVEKRKQNEMRWREFGARTILSTSSVDSRGVTFDAQTKTLFKRLSKIQNSLVSSIERNFWEAKPRMKQLVSKLNIPPHIHETAWRIYSTAAKKKMTMGRSIDGFLAASLYAAIRIHEFPRVLEEVSEGMFIPRKTVVRSLGLLVKEVLAELNLSYKPITAEQLIFKFGNELQLPMETQKKALDLLTLSFKRGLSQIGKDPKGFAASALYIATKCTNNRRTQSEVSQVAKLTEVTLRNRVKDIQEKVRINKT